MPVSPTTPFPSPTRTQGEKQHPVWQLQQPGLGSPHPQGGFEAQELSAPDSLGRWGG